MVIEWLKIPVPAAAQSEFLRQDQAIWTKMLARQPGFLAKECWRDPDSPLVLHVLIRWQSVESWKRVPKSLLDATDRAFTAALGDSYPVERCIRYDVLAPLARDPA